MVAKGGVQMNTQFMTQQQIRTAGVEILGKYIGITGMIRFLQQNETGQGDYTKDRHKFLGDPPLAQLVADIQSCELNRKE
jgi:hypothetical protein